jgi:prepilin-type N-terminal cleavage/methylation domain-containing protein
MRNRGYTLIELLLVLVVLGVLLTLAAPSFGRWRDVVAVAGARDELAGRLAWTRIAAASHGGATLIVLLPDGRYRVEVGGGGVPFAGELGRVYGVTLDAGGADSLELGFNSLGVGRMTGRTIRVVRGAAEAGLTVTPFGRYRRW